MCVRVRAGAPVRVRAPVRVGAWVRGCVCAPVRVSVRVVVWCARECTRGGLEGRLSVIV